MSYINISANIISFPRICCCCALNPPSTNYEATATRTTGKRVIRTSSKTWSFPICQHCLNWMSEQKKSNNYLLCVFISIILLIYFAINSLSQNAGVSLIVGLFFIFLWKKSKKIANAIKPNSQCTLQPVTYLAWVGTIHQFQISNEVFFNEFQKSNYKKLVG